MFILRPGLTLYKVTLACQSANSVRSPLNWSYVVSASRNVHCTFLARSSKSWSPWNAIGTTTSFLSPVDRHGTYFSWLKAIISAISPAMFGFLNSRSRQHYKIHLHKQMRSFQVHGIAVKSITNVSRSGSKVNKELKPQFRLSKLIALLNSDSIKLLSNNITIKKFVTTHRFRFLRHLLTKLVGYMVNDQRTVLMEWD